MRRETGLPRPPRDASRRPEELRATTFSAAVPTPRPAPYQAAETRSEPAILGAQKLIGRAGEIRTRGLLVPNQALCRAKLPPACAVALGGCGQILEWGVGPKV